MAKMNSYSHIISHEYSDRFHLERQIAAGRSYNPRDADEFTRRSIDETFPQYIVENRERFRNLIFEPWRICSQLHWFRIWTSNIYAKINRWNVTINTLLRTELNFNIWSIANPDLARRWWPPETYGSARRKSSNRRRFTQQISVWIRPLLFASSRDSERKSFHGYLRKPNQTSRPLDNVPLRR